MFAFGHFEPYTSCFSVPTMLLLGTHDILSYGRLIETTGLQDCVDEKQVHLTWRMFHNA